MKIGGKLGYHLLRWMKPGRSFQGRDDSETSSYVPKIRRIVGDRDWEAFQDKVILDFGCGTGSGSIEMARQGARRVFGLDIRLDLLDVARRSARDAGVSETCVFGDSVDEPVDIIVSIDAFEHFEAPAAILDEMGRLLRDDGAVLLSFGPTWYHPHGGHLFSIFPWSHLIFTEEAQIRWRSDFKHDGATCFSEVAGGLNRMTIQRFLDLIAGSPFRVELFRAVPIRPLAWAHCRMTREFTTSIVECKLVKDLGARRLDGG